jgi:hypothetical protein
MIMSIDKTGRSCIRPEQRLFTEVKVEDMLSAANENEAKNSRKNNTWRICINIDFD